MSSKSRLPVSFSRNVELIVDRALSHLELRSDLHEQIKACKAILQVQFPVKLDDGEYQLRVMATDQLGHSKQYQVDITVDNTLPVVLLQTPAVGQK